MRMVASLVLVALLASCHRGPFFKVHLEKMDGSPIFSAQTSLSKEFHTSSCGDIPGGGFERHEARVLDITQAGVLVDLVADYSPDASSGTTARAIHKQFVVSSTGTTVVNLFGKMRFCAEVSDDSSGCADHRSFPYPLPVTFIP